MKEQRAGNRILALTVEGLGGDGNGILPLRGVAAGVVGVDVEELAALADHRAGVLGEAGIVHAGVDHLRDGGAATAGLVGRFVDDDLGHAFDLTRIGGRRGRVGFGRHGIGVIRICLGIDRRLDGSGQGACGLLDGVRLAGNKGFDGRAGGSGKLQRCQNGGCGKGTNNLAKSGFGHSLTSRVRKVAVQTRVKNTKSKRRLRASPRLATEQAPDPKWPLLLSGRLNEGPPVAAGAPCVNRIAPVGPERAPM